MLSIWNINVEDAFMELGHNLGETLIIKMKH
jgi:hypothetical protein